MVRALLGRVERARGRGVGEPPVADLRRQLDQQVLFVAVEALVDDLLQAADHRPHHLPRHALAAGDLLELGGAELLERVQGPVDQASPPPGPAA